MPLSLPNTLPERDSRPLNPFEVDSEPTSSPPSPSVTSSRQRMTHSVYQSPLGEVFRDLIGHITRLEAVVISGERPIDLPRFDIDGITRKIEAGLQSQTQQTRPKSTDPQVQTYTIPDESDRYSNPLYLSRVKTPTVFAVHPQLTDLTFHQKLIKLYPQGAGKFSGKTATGPSVVEYLQTVTSIQTQFPVTQDEFYSLLLKSTTGKAYEHVHHALENNYTIPHLYHFLYGLNSKEDTPERARNKLNSYLITKDKTSMEHESNIYQLAMRASMMYPRGPERSHFANFLARDRLIAALPEAASDFVDERANDLGLRLDRTPTFSELTSELDSHRRFLDKVIAQKGLSPHKKWPGKVNWEQGEDDETQSESQSEDQEGESKWQGGRGNGRGWRGRGWRGRWRGGRGRGSGGQQTDQKEKFCSLCGQKNDHSAIDCPKMVDEKGNRREVMPTSGQCSYCPLRHPDQYCPLRPKDKKDDKDH